jgi:hypothetical protein
LRYNNSGGTKTIGLILKNSTGNVGIGTTSPDARLTVIDEVRVKTASTTGVGLSKDASGAYLYNIDNTFMAFGTNNAERMRITSGGELLINTTSDAGDYKLQVSGNIYSSGSITTLSTLIAGGNGLYQNGTTNILNVGTDQNMYGGTNSDGGIFVYGNNKLHLSTNSVRRLTISGTGNVGIGTTAPSEKLEVNGNIKTAAPSGGTAQPWKLGEKVTIAATTLNATDYLQVEVNGVAYKLALIN